MPGSGRHLLGLQGRGALNSGAQELLLQSPQEVQAKSLAPPAPPGMPIYLGAPSFLPPPASSSLARLYSSGCTPSVVIKLARILMAPASREVASSELSVVIVAMQLIASKPPARMRSTSLKPWSCWSLPSFQMRLRCTAALASRQRAVGRRAGPDVTWCRAFGLLQLSRQSRWTLKLVIPSSWAPRPLLVG